MSEGTVSSTNYLYFSLIYVNSIHAHPQVSRPWALNLANKTLPAHETSNIYKVLAQAFFAMSMWRAKVCLNCRPLPLRFILYNGNAWELQYGLWSTISYSYGTTFPGFPLLTQLISPRAQICVFEYFANEKFSLMSSVRVSLVESMSASFKR